MTVLDLLLPHRCPLAGGPAPAPCAECRTVLPPPPDLPPPAGVDRCVAAVAYAATGGRWWPT